MTESITYVRERFLEAEKPPASEKSAYAWIRNNLFASWKDSILSIIAIAAIVFAGSWLLYEFVVRRVAVLRPLFGLKVAPRRPHAQTVAHS